MGEIKSTLDLVMERTRHLSMSVEDKEHQQRENFNRRLQGVLQQFSDGALSMEALRERIKGLQSELSVTDPSTVMKVVLNSIDPDGHNTHWLALIEGLDPTVRQRLEHILGDYLGNRADLVRGTQARQLERLAEDHGIRGSAVIPNPDRDAAFQERLSTLRRQTREAIEAVGNA